MAASSSISSLTPPSIADFLFKPKDNQKTIETKIAKAMVFAMSELTRSYRKKIEDSKPLFLMSAEELKQKQALLRVGPWTPQDFYTRCKELNADKLLNHLRKGNHLLRGYMNPLHFDLKGPEDLDEYVSHYFFFRAKPGQNAYELTLNTSTSFSLIDCGVAIRIAQYQALAYCFGPEKFNALFSDKLLGRINFTSRLSMPHQPLLQVLGNTNKRSSPSSSTGVSEKRKLALGEFCYIKGHPEYSLKHYCGLSRGLNAICTSIEDSPKFTTFGHPVDSTEDELKAILLNAYNKDSEQWYRKLSTDEDQKQNEKEYDTRDALRFNPSFITPASITSIPGYIGDNNQIFNSHLLYQFFKIHTQTLLTRAILRPLNSNRTGKHTH